MPRSGGIPDNTLSRRSLNAQDDRLEREDLSAIYKMISPTDSPFMTMIGDKKVDRAYHEWPIDELADPEKDNARADGADAGDQALTVGHKLGNFMQISDKVVRLSTRAQQSRTAYNRKEMARQMAKKMKELKRDQESILLNPQAGKSDTAIHGNAAPAAGTAPTTATLPSWFRSNVDRGPAVGANAAGASPTLSEGNAGYPNAIPTDAGKTRALTKSKIDEMIAKTYIAGGDPMCIMVHPYVKQQLSEFLFTDAAKVAQIRTNVGQGRGQGMKPGVVAVGAVDYYRSDFGQLEVKPNRWQRERDVFFLDKEYFKLGILRRLRTVRLAKTGDSDRRQMLIDYGLISYNEEASGIIADIDHTQAVTA